MFDVLFYVPQNIERIEVPSYIRTTISGGSKPHFLYEIELIIGWSTMAFEKGATYWLDHTKTIENLNGNSMFFLYDFYLSL